VPPTVGGHTPANAGTQYAEASPLIAGAGE